MVKETLLGLLAKIKRKMVKDTARFSGHQERSAAGETRMAGQQIPEPAYWVFFGASKIAATVALTF